MHEADIHDVEHQQANLRYLLNQWDPIGVADLAADEYDSLIAPLWSRLSRGATRAEISEFLSGTTWRVTLAWIPRRARSTRSPTRCVVWAAGWGGGV